MATTHKLRSVFPPGVSIRDFGYPDTHHFHAGDYRLWYDGDVVHGTDAADDDASDGDDDGVAGSDDAYEEAGSDDDGDTATSDEINRQAIALFSFTPENDNEMLLKEGQIIWISYRHGQGWLVAEDPESGETGLVPEEYVEICYDRQGIIEDIPRPFLPSILNGFESPPDAAVAQNDDDDDDEGEWVDTDFEDGDDDHLVEDVAKLRVK
ncbi:hypothetical protein DIURU_004618 [Diutina rugosa]|uniref:SH3 domain-containing protein n=1 Tax=Diutina rugosa TaxID=5481 RepID=A0A642UKS6_DIURU|nr:uncharacterized protein DIURU_004618 [Diutina rugosa]KAA8898598.1 hypothetical protein DIURU_004618 [Diutina rugosa]